jgi:amino acid transporter
MSQREHLPQSDQALGEGDPETKGTSLKKGTLGLFGIIFFVVAAAAPVAGMTGAFPVAIALGDGAGAAGMYVAVGIVLLLFSVGYATMSHYVTNTGAFFAYVGRGLGIVPGVGSAFVSTLAYLTVQWGVLGFLSGQLDFYMQAKFSIDIDWWIYAIVLILIVWVLSALSVDIGAKVLGVFLTVEVVALLILAVAILAQGGASGIDFGASFNPSNIFAGGLSGGAGIAFASLSCCSVKERSFFSASFAPRVGPWKPSRRCATRPSEWMLRTTARRSLPSKRSTEWKQSWLGTPSAAHASM